MCLMLYIGSERALSVAATPDLRLEAVGKDRTSVRQWFSQPSVQFVGAHTGCSCGFPSVIADPALEYYEGMPLESDQRDADLRSVRQLIALLGQLVTPNTPVELYPIADGDEGAAPRGVVEWRVDQLVPERMFFNEGYLPIVRKE